MARITTSPGYSFTIRLRIENTPGRLASVLAVIARHKGDPGSVDVVRAERAFKVRDLTVNAHDEKHAATIVADIKKLKGVEVVHVTDRVFRLHHGGKICIQSKVPLDNRDTLSMAYTPGVARVCEAIAARKPLAHVLTIKRNSVAVVTDGSAVLGLGNIGPEAAMPVMEGKAMLFKEFGGVDAYPICLRTQDPDEIVLAVKWISTGFGGINLEDISAPRCFEIERRLKEELDIPVFHDDQHGTAIVVLAATINALKIGGRKLPAARIAIAGAGAAGVAIAKILLAAGARQIIVCDRKGIVSKKRWTDLDNTKKWLAENTNPENLSGSLDDAVKGAHLFIGVSAPRILSVRAAKTMAKEPAIFALANPVPEIMPEEAESFARIIATGRSDYPNQINNVLAFPGVFRGALDVHARDINEAMKLAAARAIAECISDDELNEEYIVPSVFNKRVSHAVAEAVSQAAIASGVARHKPGHRFTGT
ncbi:MAG: NAD-dependent malic enzyme [Verrucomicrobiae bacterium]|nr:NAD-dependent malic enzyme [Verrucomicrobiae bacterium]